MELFQEAWGTPTLDSYLPALLEKKTGPNGVFGLKVHHNQLGDILGQRDPAEVFPNLRFIYITRRDRIRQAVSFARAMQTEQWASDHPPPSTPPHFDAAQISALLRWIERDERRWERFFAQRSISPLRVVYEEFVESMEATLLAVMRFLRIPIDEHYQMDAPTLQRQADELSDEWVRRYIGAGTVETIHSTSSQRSKMGAAGFEPATSRV